MLPAVIIGIIGVVGGLLGYAWTRPSSFRVERSATMKAPVGQVFEQVNDLHKWEVWSPWGKLDPNMKLTYEGALAGEGAGYAWSGNRKVGQGRITIVESHPDTRIRLRLEFLKPFKATNTAEFTFHSDGGRTTVTWSMTGEHSFIGKLMCVFVNMDKMIGRDFEKGLSGIKSLVEFTA